MKKLWYDKAAGIWEEALPVGNGRIGAMVFSGAISDKLALNEETLWSGFPKKPKRQHDITELDEIRSLVENKKYYEAGKITSDIMLGDFSAAYVPYGTLYIDIITEKTDVQDFRRELNMETGIVCSEYKLNGIGVEKQIFTSLADDVLVINIKTDKPFDYNIYQSVVLENMCSNENETVKVCGRCPTDVSTFNNTVEYDAQKESIHFCSYTGVITDDYKYAGGNTLWIKNSCDVTVVFSISTSFNGYNKMPDSDGREYVLRSREKLLSAKEFTFDELKKRHITKYKELFDRCSLKIDGEDFSDIPTDKRIKNVSDGIVDNELITLLFDFGRYLMISSSAPCTQPSTLQGIWSYKLIAPWRSNYTMNINTEMNYWATETVGLSECHMPLLRMIKDFSETGNNFGLRGWSSWHCSDIWRFNTECGNAPNWGFWQMGGFWCVRHIWEHYIHTGDIGFLKEYYPVIKGAAEFLEDWMYENKEGKLTTCPSTSPENIFKYNEEICCICQGSAMDMSIIFDVFDKLIKASEILNIDSSHEKKIISRLDNVKIGKDGCILEWGEELVEAEPGHRHFSSLYGFFPSDVLSGSEYTEAVKKTLEKRMSNGSGSTGWSNAWAANLYARLGDSEEFLNRIKNMFKNAMYPNMTDMHPPFQIDGNFGILSAICEALMQSHTGEIKLLPALPKEWKSGEIKGFIARNGERISFKWNENKVWRV